MMKQLFVISFAAALMLVATQATMAQTQQEYSRSKPLVLKKGETPVDGAIATVGKTGYTYYADKGRWEAFPEADRDKGNKRVETLTNDDLIKQGVIKVEVIGGGGQNDDGGNGIDGGGGDNQIDEGGIETDFDHVGRWVKCYHWKRSCLGKKRCVWHWKWMSGNNGNGEWIPATPPYKTGDEAKYVLGEDGGTFFYRFEESDGEWHLLRKGDFRNSERFGAKTTLSTYEVEFWLKGSPIFRYVK